MQRRCIRTALGHESDSEKAPGGRSEQGGGIVPGQTEAGLLPHQQGALVGANSQAFLNVSCLLQSGNQDGPISPGCDAQDRQKYKDKKVHIEVVFVILCCIERHAL
jgi:hypothetical protein